MSNKRLYQTGEGEVIYPHQTIYTDFYSLYQRNRSVLIGQDIPKAAPIIRSDNELYRLIRESSFSVNGSKKNPKYSLPDIQIEPTRHEDSYYSQWGYRGQIEEIDGKKYFIRIVRNTGRNWIQSFTDICIVTETETESERNK